MKLELTDLHTRKWTGFDTVIDVRAPAEFAEDHIPGALNLPVLSDAERARVGTVHAQEAPFAARKLGAALVARNTAHYLETALRDKDGGWQPLVYCWRGGQRSGAFATILGQIGWRVQTLAGGYRAYRRLVVAALYQTPWPGTILRIDGNTGTAKTALLAHLRARGVQVADLERLARHRGSALGSMAGGQPGQKGFETALAGVLAGLDPARPLVVEAESSKIGDLSLPPSLWKAMAGSPRIVVQAAPEVRARYLARAYRDLTADAGALRDRLDRLRPLQGHAVVDHWHALACQGAFEALALSLVTRHYDRAYARARARHDPGRVVATLDGGELSAGDLDRMASEIDALLQQPDLDRRLDHVPDPGSLKAGG